MTTKTNTDESCMKLFHIQDNDRPMYVVAESWQAALDSWKALVRAENDGDEGDEPNGIAIVCDQDDLLLPSDLRALEDGANKAQS